MLLPANLRHAGSPMEAKPDIQLCAHLCHLRIFAGFSEADVGQGRFADPRKPLQATGFDQTIVPR
ncbi:hypothetical protein [Methylobacterium sp. E-066]|uniref:hypothetical protein n=1 Tax=Methylobacterium sp. E-066 TaxID=2836584 RepID=UPI001FB9905B|nr:hypothetical protein [Methylobacterium sp. E-066]MCJ2138625.1 hypothetical protein [Methylobacterium sp. E-066]